MEWPTQRLVDQPHQEGYVLPLVVGGHDDAEVHACPLLPLNLRAKGIACLGAKVHVVTSSSVQVGCLKASQAAWLQH